MLMAAVGHRSCPSFRTSLSHPAIQNSKILPAFDVGGLIGHCSFSSFSNPFRFKTLSMLVIRLITVAFHQLFRFQVLFAFAFRTHIRTRHSRICFHCWWYSLTTVAFHRFPPCFIRQSLCSILCSQNPCSMRRFFLPPTHTSPI